MTQASDASPPAPGVDGRTRRNVVILSIAQALYMTGGAIQITISGLVGYLLADDKSLATIPVTAYVLGTLVSTMPASMFMRYAGRRRGFQLGALMGFASAMLAVYAIYQASFWLFCFALTLTGTYQAFAQYYRFAAADTASEEFRPKAISWVLLGGLAAAVAGPQIVIYAKDILAPVLYAGAFAASAVTAFIAIMVVSLIDIPKAPSISLDGEPPRPLRVILGQRKLKVAIFSGMVSYASMSFVMTATPLAMIASHHSVESAALAIQWHVLAMFAPSFFTGNLISRFGREPVILFGLFLLGCAGLVALSGIALWQYNLAMMLLGLGWNFGYIGSTTLVTDCHRPEERNKVQAINEFMIFGFVALASFSSGKLLHLFGWATLTISYLPLVALAAVMVLMLAFSSRRAELRKP